MSQLVYKLDILKKWQIHDVIFITQLKFMFKKNNSYNQSHNNLSLSVEYKLNNIN